MIKYRGDARDLQYESDLPKQPRPQASWVQNYQKCPLCPYLPLLACNKLLEMAGFLAFLSLPFLGLVPVPHCTAEAPSHGGWRIDEVMGLLEVLE